MLRAVNTTQGYLVLILGILALCLQGFALFDAVRQRKDAFTAAGKLTKPIWVGILTLATVLGFIFVSSPLGFLDIIAVVAAGVYLADVRPALRQVSGGGGGGGSGPYGPW